MPKYSRGLSFSYNPDTGVCYRVLTFLGFPHYRVGDDGSVWSCNRCWANQYKAITSTGSWKRLRPYPNGKGYLLISLNRLGKSKCFQVHRLILMAFVGPCPEGMQACHFPDEDKGTNRLDNLRWGTASENYKHRYIHGTAIIGEKSGKAKLTEQKVCQIRSLARTGDYSLRGIGRLFGVSVDCIIDCISGRTWNHVV